jgi:hypothetical protein
MLFELVVLIIRFSMASHEHATWPLKYLSCISSSHKPKPKDERSSVNYSCYDNLRSADVWMIQMLLLRRVPTYRLQAVECYILLIQVIWMIIASAYPG